MKTIIDTKTGKVLYSFIDGIEIQLLENEVMIDKVMTDDFENAHYDFTTNTFYNVYENAN
jgi:hypothetical protein